MHTFQNFTFKISDAILKWSFVLGCQDFNPQTCHMDPYARDPRANGWTKVNFTLNIGYGKTQEVANSLRMHAWQVPEITWRGQVVDPAWSTTSWREVLLLLQR